MMYVSVNDDCNQTKEGVHHPLKKQATIFMCNKNQRPVARYYVHDKTFI
jgi:hypothetical protein